MFDSWLRRHAVEMYLVKIFAYFVRRNFVYLFSVGYVLEPLDIITNILTDAAIAFH